MDFRHSFSSKTPFSPAPPERSCCFTGHRRIPPEWQARLGSLLTGTVASLAQEGITDFYCGGALGFDTMAAATVLNQKRVYPDIRLILALPCADQADRWRIADRVMYEKIRERADHVVLLSQTYTPTCMGVRNRYMADASSVCVSFVLHSGGGSASTEAYARRRGCRIIALAQF